MFIFYFMNFVNDIASCLAIVVMIALVGAGSAREWSAEVCQAQRGAAFAGRTRSHGGVWRERLFGDTEKVLRKGYWTHPPPAP